MNVYDKELEINAENEKRTYYEIIPLPAEAATKVLKSTFLNGFLEVTFKKKRKKEKSQHSLTGRCSTSSNG